MTAAHYTDTSIFDGIVEYTTPHAAFRAFNEDAAWGIHRKRGDAYVRVATIRRESGDGPREIDDRYYAALELAELA